MWPQGMWRTLPLTELILTYIQPVFDGSVQHGEVCEEDSQIGHGALSAGLCVRGKKNVFQQFPKHFYSEP